MNNIDTSKIVIKKDEKYFYTVSLGGRACPFGMTIGQLNEYSYIALSTREEYIAGTKWALKNIELVNNINQIHSHSNVPLDTVLYALSDLGLDASDYINQSVVLMTPGETLIVKSKHKMYFQTIARTYILPRKYKGIIMREWVQVSVDNNLIFERREAWMRALLKP